MKSEVKVRERSDGAMNRLEERIDTVIKLTVNIFDRKSSED